MRRLISITCLLIVSVSCAPSQMGVESRFNSPTEFRDLVLARLQEHYPDRTFDKTDDPQVLRYGDTEIGLQNLKAKCQSDTLSSSDIDAIILEHFDAMFDDIDQIVETESISWDEAREIIRPQLAPAEYLDTMELPHTPFCEGVVQTYVLDHERRYQFVTSEDTERWEISNEELKSHAFENLSSASAGLGFQISNEPNLFMALETGDGYDAARLLLPGIREFAAEQLGEPYFAAIPNRDFLIMWSETCTGEFKEHARRSIVDDFEAQPYPLSPIVFRVTKSKIIPTE